MESNRWYAPLGRSAEEMEAAMSPQSGRASTNAGEVITPEQGVELRRLIGETGSSESRFYAYLKVRALEELPGSRFEAAKGALSRKRNGKAQEVQS